MRARLSAREGFATPNVLPRSHSLRCCCCHDLGFVADVSCWWVGIWGLGMVACRDGWNLWEIKSNSQESERRRYLTAEGLTSQASISGSLYHQSRCVTLQQWDCYHSIAAVRARIPLIVTPGIDLPLSVAEIKRIVRGQQRRFELHTGHVGARCDSLLFPCAGRVLEKRKLW
jgi:hypothetical protein